MTYSIRAATPGDLDRAADMVAAGRAYLAAQGSPQWQGGYGPDRPYLAAQIAAGQGRVLLLDSAVGGYASLVPGVDPVYTAITGGQWEGTHDRYIAIHSVALDPSVRGRGLAAHFLAALAEESIAMGCRDVRIDTHRQNEIMQRAILRAGFTYRGLVHFPIPDGERMAYQLTRA